MLHEVWTVFDQFMNIFQYIFIAAGILSFALGTFSVILPKLPKNN